MKSSQTQSLFVDETSYHARWEAEMKKCLVGRIGGDIPKLLELLLRFGRFCYLITSSYYVLLLHEHFCSALV